jgi:hypothetical protein
LTAASGAELDGSIQCDLHGIGVVIEHPTTHPDIRNAFDSITYTKGGVPLTMFEATSVQRRSARTRRGLSVHG